jgi:hypothetical protein
LVRTHIKGREKAVPGQVFVETGRAVAEAATAEIEAAE